MTSKKPLMPSAPDLKSLLEPIIRSECEGAGYPEPEDRSASPESSGGDNVLEGSEPTFIADGALVWIRSDKVSIFVAGKWDQLERRRFVSERSFLDEFRRMLKSALNG
jgi:hypothetical protein